MTRRRDADVTLAEVVGANILRLRLGRGWTQQQLADKCGVNRRTVIRVESGAVDLPLTSLTRLAEGLDVEPAHLLILDAVAKRLIQ